ncbi:F0F1 ATP synthase subunit gamma [Anaplasma capra]|uniref:F0F1 ATP synthase subunit gamma n=1 Tax=Anaplasma capra TaxID=1562740 RepID=UPI0021D60D9E|nr:F0F1 ATP synthase subunit gamma [Anaplasma capra]MCU7611641.1 F0F1 ATP synthase subunit gamma [Anaplasma capra]
MANLKALSSRIKSVKSIQKTTRVMQMISASKFRIAKEGVARARDYCDRVDREATEHGCLVGTGEASSGVLLVVFSSDRGLCGGFNHLIARALREYLASVASSNAQEKLHFLFVGTKACESVGKGYLEAFGEVIGVVPQPKGLGFLNFKSMLYGLSVDLASYSRVVALYSKFHSFSRQEPVMEDVLVISSSEDSRDFGVVSEDKVTCSYDPDLASVRRKLCLSRCIGRLYLALCDSLTCEHCCRMVAMESANSNTKSMLDRLLLDYNRSRQASITTDLIEVVSGCEALG